jgi:hypothetical protein
MDSKLACQIPECEKKHTERLHDMLAGLNANVNLVTEEDEGEEENGYVNVARGEQCEENRGGWETLDDSWLEMEAAGEDKEEVFYVNILTGEEDGIEQDGGRKEEVQKRAVRAKDRPVQWRKRRKIRLEVG